MVGTYIGLIKGGIYDFVEPKPEMIHAEDIARALSNQCRYAGHVPKLYSVAEHCVRVAAMLKADGRSIEIQFKGLLHDASEAYCVDIPLPLKHRPEIESGYAYYEERAQEAIAQAFGLSMPLEDPVVMAADKAILEPEQAWRRGNNALPFGWMPAYAEQSYLDKFKDLSKAWREECLKLT